MKQFFSVLFLFSFISGFGFAQDAADINPNPPVKTFIPEGQNIPTPYESDFALLHDNGPIITHPGGGAGGNDASALQTTLGMGTYGFGHAVSSGFSVADDFTVTGNGWNIDEFQFFAYQTNSGTTSTINAVRIQIYNGPPDAGGTVVWGDLTTNRLTATNWLNIYRVLDTDLLNTARPVMRVVATLGTPINLAAGTYWVRWQVGGTLASGPWVPAVTILGQTTTGNAKQADASNVWTNLVDVGPQGLPFLIFGNPVPIGNTFFEDFEGFIAGQQVACQDPVNWTVWPPATPCDPVVDAFVSTTYSYSPTKSAVIVADNDLVKPLGNKTSDIWYIDFMVYIPSTKSGYFNTLAVFTPPSTFDWAFECYFDVGGGGRITNVPGAPINFSYPVGAWFPVSLTVNFNATPTQAILYVNNVMVLTWDWTQGGSVTDQLAGNDFYGAAATDQMYFDDYRFSDTPIPVELTSFTANVNNLGQVVLNWETATETNNQGFEIERRTETSEFITIGFVEGYGTTTEQRSYSFIDKAADNGINYYRLKQIDYDGTFAYSEEVEIEVSSPLTFDLAQNYPNPFNPSTSIKYSVPESGNIRLSVFNIVGEEVAVLANGFTQAGNYEVTFDASNLSTGVYLYKLQSANSVQTKKMMLLK